MNREEKLLEYEKELCILFYEQFTKKHHRALDAITLDDQVKMNFIERSKIFARTPLVIAETYFVQTHIGQIKRV